MYHNSTPISSFRGPSYTPSHFPTQVNGLSKRRTPNMTEEGPPGPGPPNDRLDTSDAATEEDPRVITFRNAYHNAEAALTSLLRGEIQSFDDTSDSHHPVVDEESPVEAAPPVAKKPARAIDEDDYDDEEEEEDDDKSVVQSPILRKTSNAIATNGNASPTVSSINNITKSGLLNRGSQTSDSTKAPDDARKKIQKDQQVAEDAARFGFHSMFYTLEYDRAAMLEQQRIDELDRQVEAEMSADQRNGTNSAAINGVLQGSLSSANLGASSLMLKHLLARIDAKRNLVKAQDWQLRKLISEVRKNRSKWASEDKIGQEELYEAAEKVLSDLKAMTEHSGPFLNRVNKREAPDYYNIIKHPMDIGTMMKKLKGLQYKSKKEFVDDLNLIWSNCLTYNTDTNHPLRKKALHLQKHSEQMLFLIPDIVVRDRAEVEAEERRLQNLDAELEGLEDSDDEPIMASRGRKAPSKVAKKGSSTARKAPPSINEGTPAPDMKDTKPNAISGQGIRNNFLQADLDAPMEGIINGFSTPPPPGGNLTPIGINGVMPSGASQTDLSDAEGPGFSANDLTQADEPEYFDLEFRTWKQVTKKARAAAAGERNRLFINGHLNPEEPAILRSKAGMRRFVRLQRKFLQPEGAKEDASTSESKDEGSSAIAGETLAEGVEAAEDDYILPDYYDPVSSIPEVNERLKWEEDDEGQVISHAEECLRLVPEGQFTTPESTLGKKMNANMKQMQDTRKICAKIAIVKQMQLQTQVYQNQFQKYDPAPFFESDISAHVVSDDGPIMSPDVCRAAFQRSIAKILYHAGFEDYQPSALETLTDCMGDFFQRLIATFVSYANTPKVPIEKRNADTKIGALQPKYSLEESLMHTLEQNSIDIEALDAYVKDDLDRLGQKLTVMHERMKAHLADLLRPALDPNAGVDGAGAFNDGSDQFVGGDFAVDIDEDFFGFRELGLDREFSMHSLNVPFHLLQNRMHSAYQNQSTHANSGEEIMPQPAPIEPVTVDNVQHEVGIIQAFFLNRLINNKNESLIEDDDLPPKQRFPKPRLPPTGKITSPRKRPIREQQQLAKKKRKLEEGREELLVNGVRTVSGGSLSKGGPTVSKIRLDPIVTQTGPVGDPEKEDEGTGMVSPPESL